MDEIFALQAALAKAQLADSAHRISERNAVEIVLKLMQLKKVQLLFTKSGREYVTPAQVVEEVEMELVSAGGRVTLTDLPALLNLDLNHVETAARALCVKKGKKVVELAGQLIADYYLDTIVEEINETLQESGSCGLVDLAQRFALPADFMRQAIETRMGPGGVQGYIEDGQLYTASFIQLHAARTRGIMRALVRPTNLRTLIQRHGLMESRLSKEIAALLKEGAIRGTLKGAEDRAIYTPDLFVRGQHAGVDSFFVTNGYVDYKLVERLSVPNPKAFLAAKYPTAMQLSSMALSESMVQSVQMAAEDAHSAHLFVNAQSILPNVLSKSEVQQVLEAAVVSTNKAAGADKSQLQVLAEVWAVSSLFTAEAKAHLSKQLERWLDEEEVRLDAAAAAASAAASSSSAGAAAPAASSSAGKKSSKAALPDSDDDEPAAPAKKVSAPAAKDKKKGGKKGAASSDDEDEPAPKAAAAKKGGAKAKRGKRGDDSDDDDAPVAEPKAKGKIKLPASAATAPAPLTRDRVSKWLKSGWSSIVKGAQQGNAEIQQADNDESTDELQQALATMLHPSLLPLHKARCTARAAALAAAAGAASSSASVSSGSGLGPGSEAVLRRQQLECFRANVQEQYEQILLYQHAIDFLGGKSSEAAAAAPGSIALLADKMLLSQLESHLNKTLCAALLDVILRMEAFSSLTVVQQNHLAGMDNIICVAPVAAAASSSSDDNKSAPSPLTRFDLNRTPLSSKERDAVLGALPKRSSDGLKPLAETVAKAQADPAVFLERLEAAARSLDLTLKKLDKKSERSRVFALRKSLMASLADERKPAVVLHLTILLLFAKVHGTVPHAPAKCIPTIRRLLRPATLPVAYAKLRRYNQLVKRALRADNDESAAASSAAAAAASSAAALGSDSEDESADADLPLDQQVKYMSAAAITQELNSNMDAIRAFGLDANTAVKDTKGANQLTSSGIRSRSRSSCASSGRQCTSTANLRMRGRVGGSDVDVVCFSQLRAFSPGSGSQSVMHPASPGSAPSTRHRKALAQLQSAIGLGTQSSTKSAAASVPAPASSSLSAAPAASPSSSYPVAPPGKENRTATPALSRAGVGRNAAGIASNPPLIPLAEDDDGAASSEAAASSGSGSGASSSLRGLFNPAFDAPNLASTNIGKTTQTSMGAMKERIAAAALAGRAIARGSATPTSAPTTPQRSTTDENAIEEDRDLFASRTTTASTPSFVPVPLVAKQPTSAPFLGQRLARDVVPSAGKLTELRNVGQRTLFPAAAGSAPPTSARAGSAAGASFDASLLHQGVDQVLATKDNARRYIELMRKRMASYVVLNREYAHTHANEQMRNQGIIALRKTLDSHVKQLGMLQKELKLQHAKRDTQMREQQEQLQQELTDAQAEIEALQRAIASQTRTDSAEKLEQKKQWDQIKASLEQQLADQKADSAAAAQQLSAAVEAAKAEKQSMAADAVQLNEEINDLRSQLVHLQNEMQRKEESWHRERQRMQQQAASSRSDGPITASELESSLADLRSQLIQAEADRSDAVEHSRRCELGLAHACNELDRVLSEKAEAEAHLEETSRDLETMLAYSERNKRKHAQLLASKDHLATELNRAELQLRRKQIELDEMAEIQSATHAAYKSTEKDSKLLQASVAMLSHDVIRLRDALHDLCEQQSECVPLPREVLSWNPDMAKAAMEADDSMPAASPNALASSVSSSPLERSYAASTPFSSPLSSIPRTPEPRDSSIEAVTIARYYAPDASWVSSNISAVPRVSPLEDLSASMHQLSFGSTARRLSMTSAINSSAESQPGRSGGSSFVTGTMPLTERREQSSPPQARSTHPANRTSPPTRMSSASSSAASSPSDSHRDFHDQLQHRRQQRAATNSHMQRIHALIDAEEEQ